MNTKISFSVLVLLAAGTAQAAPTFYGANAPTTTTVLNGGDRELLRMGFVGTGDFMTGGNFLNWTDGTLRQDGSSYGWNDIIPRDVGPTNNVTANPDRADNSTPYFSEPSPTGTLAEVFGPFNGYKNMSRIIDSEALRPWQLDLAFGQGFNLAVDNDASTVELSFLERGANSDMMVYGIKADGSLTSGIFVGRSSYRSAGWELDTLEIARAQTVGGVGVSLDAEWNGVVGIRIDVQDTYNGPDLVAVGAKVVPAPGTVALLGAAGLLIARRRR
jgi:hypothetical protein